MVSAVTNAFISGREIKENVETIRESGAGFVAAESADALSDIGDTVSKLLK